MKERMTKRELIFYMMIAAVLVVVVINFYASIVIVRKVFAVMTPVLMGAIFAFILNVIMEKYEKVYFSNSDHPWVKRSRRMVSILLSLLTIFGIIVGLLVVIIPQMIKAIRTIVHAFPAWYDKAMDFAERIINENPDLLSGWSGEITKQGENLWNTILENGGQWAAGALSAGAGFFGLTMNIILGLVIAIYILADKENLQRQFSRLMDAYLPEKVNRNARLLFSVGDDTFSKYLVGQSIEACILGVLCFIGMVIFRFPYAGMIAPVVGVTNIVPIVGPYIGAVLGVFMVLTVDPMKAVFFLVFIIVLQQIEGNLIMPRVVGGSIGLPALWVLVSILVFGGLFGVVGVLFAVPIASTMYKLLRMSIQTRLVEHNHLIGPPAEDVAEILSEE